VVAGAPNAQTLVELMRPLGQQDTAGKPALAQYRLTPLTGRRHQLRAQLNALGLPIVGDRIYPTLWPEPAADAPPDYTQPLQLLARGLSFIDPLSGALRRFVSARQLARTEGD
jgi:tRNA pseudouridine32 synthase/23S rRNA pseudouridine746 synthase